jgi:hypothetical protein
MLIYASPIHFEEDWTDVAERKGDPKRPWK